MNKTLSKTEYTFIHTIKKFVIYILGGVFYGYCNLCTF